ncbi:MAG: rhomboid family intramembrane serine protease [Pseudomonadota bacterium]
MGTDTALRLRHARSCATLAESALVLEALGIRHRIEFDGREWGLWVAVEDAPAAGAELDTYERENASPRAAPPRAEVVDSGWLGILGYLLVIWALPSLEASAALGWDWREIGVMDAALVREGEWWRTVTALTLHGGLDHLVANSLFGAVFGLFVGRYLGSGVGWLLVLLGGAVGNGANALIRGEVFRSVGASTATFAALALVGAFVWRRGYLRGWGWRRRFAPVFAGIALLVYTGFGGGNTDVVAHITGFASGLVLGVAAAGMDLWRLGTRGQWLGGTLAAALIAVCWGLAGATV